MHILLRDIDDFDARGDFKIGERRFNFVYNIGRDAFDIRTKDKPPIPIGTRLSQVEVMGRILKNFPAAECLWGQLVRNKA